MTAITIPFMSAFLSLALLFAGLAIGVPKLQLWRIAKRIREVNCAD